MISYDIYYTSKYYLKWTIKNTHRTYILDSLLGDNCFRGTLLGSKLTWKGNLPRPGPHPHTLLNPWWGEGAGYLLPAYLDMGEYDGHICFYIGSVISDFL